MIDRRAGSEQGIVRLVRPGDPSGVPIHVGLGMLVTPRLVVTCAHVVNVCLGCASFRAERPGSQASIDVSFPILGDKETFAATVVDWSPPGSAGVDCAILRLHEDAPAAAGLTILSLIEGDTIRDDPFSVYGSPEPRDPGKHLAAKLTGAVGAKWIQLDIDGDGSVQPGYSGGAVWDRYQQAAVGMLIARRTESGGTTAYFLPANRIVEHMRHGLPVEVRRVPQRRQRSFTATAVLLFLLMLAHFLANRQRDGLDLPWTHDDRTLAAFFGLHCFALFLGPYVMWNALTHARSFAARPWWQRVPVAFGTKSSRVFDNTRLGAFAVIVFLLVMPAVAQARFLDHIFFADTDVYALKRGFPDTARAWIACADGQDWCRHPDAGLWSIIAWSPFFDHAYQIAGMDRTCGDTSCMVTFFPILQPALLWTGSLATLILFALFIVALIRPWPYSARSVPNTNKGN